MSQSSKAKIWDDRYDHPEFYYGTDPSDFLKDHQSLFKKGGKLLCLAEGEGRNAVFLAKLGFDVHAVDQSKVGLEKAVNLAKENPVHLTTLVSDLEHFDFGTSEWDGIVSIWCHLPPLLRAAVHKKVVAGLKPGGIFLLEAYHPDQLNFKTGGPPTADLMMTAQDLKNELVGLDFEVIQEIQRTIKEGQGHDGMSAVTQVIARKIT